MSGPTPRTAWATLIAACLGFLFSAADIVLLIFFQTEVAAALGVELQQVRAAIGVGLLGSAVGGMFFAQLGDRWGRVRTLGLSVLLYSASTAGMGLVDGIGLLFALRFLAGIGTGGEWSLGFAMVAEAWPQAGRGARGGLVAAMFNLGTFLATVLYQSGIGWRWAFALMLLPSLGVAWLRRHVPESAAFRGLQEARARGEVPAALAGSVLRAPVGAVFRGPWRGVTLKLTALFAFLNFAFYSFATLFMQYLQSPVVPAAGVAGPPGLGMSKADELPYQIALNIAALVGVLGAGALSDRLGRRRVFGLCALLGGLGFAGLALSVGGAATGRPPAGLLVAFAVCCLAFGVNGVLGAWAPELYPTHLRTTGPGFAQNLGKGVGGLLGPVVAGKLLPTVGYAVVLGAPGVFFIGAALMAFLLPRVDGRALAALEDESFLSSG